MKSIQHQKWTCTREYWMFGFVFGEMKKRKEKKRKEEEREKEWKKEKNKMEKNE